jgi:hypothetical protein
MGEADGRAALRVLDDEDDPQRYVWAEDLDPAGSGVAEDGVPGDGVPDWAGPGTGGTPGLIAGVLAAGGDPAGKTDAELIDSMAGWQQVIAMAQGRLLRETEEVLRRRRPRYWDRGRPGKRRGEPGDPDPGGPAAGRAHSVGAGDQGRPAAVASREAAEEAALALTLTSYGARAHVDLTADLSNRLPLAFAELDAGRADLDRVKVIADFARDLGDEDARKLDAVIAAQCGAMTAGALRDRLRRLLASLDPAAAEKRCKRSERRARFVLYGNAEGTATAAIERIPAAQGAAAKARVSAIARACRAAGAAGPLPLLEAKIAAGLLLGTLPDIPPGPGTGPAPGSPGQGSPAPGSPGPDDGPGGAPGTEDAWPGLEPDDPGPDDPDPDGAAGDHPGDEYPDDAEAGDDAEDEDAAGDDADGEYADGRDADGGKTSQGLRCQAASWFSCWGQAVASS